MIAIHICAPNDANGNPQRAYAVLHGDEVIAVIDEGYDGEQAVARDFPRAAGVVQFVPERINVSPEEYRRWLSFADDDGNPLTKED